MVTQTQLNTIRSEVKIRMGNASNPLHEMNHIQQVVYNAKKLAKILNLEKNFDKNLLLACCYTHDLTYASSPFAIKAYIFEGRLVKKPALEVLKLAKINQKDQETIINAISKHPHSFPFKRLNKDQNSYTKILQDADTLELFNEERIKRLFKFTGRGLKKAIRSYIKFGYKNLKKYLNYPEIAKMIKLEYQESRDKEKLAKIRVDDRT